jgi:hypothetical protein
MTARLFVVTVCSQTPKLRKQPASSTMRPQSPPPRPLRGAPRETEPRDLDPADFGTAFGLDLSLAPNQGVIDEGEDKRAPWVRDLARRLRGAD